VILCNDSILNDVKMELTLVWVFKLDGQYLMNNRLISDIDFENVVQYLKSIYDILLID